MIRLAALILMLIAFVQAAMAAELAEEKALIDAAFALDLKGVRAALTKGANPNIKRFERSSLGGTTLTPVLLSVVLGHPTKDNWLQASANKDEFVGVGQSIAQTRTEIAKAFFDAGATLVRLDDISRSILWSSSIRMGNASLVRLLIDHGAAVTKKIFPEDVTPAELALMEGQQVSYELLVARGATPVTDASSPQFSLIASAERSDVGGMERALEHGAKVNNVTHDQTALMVALSQYIYTEAQLNAIKWLLDHGADPNVGSRFDLPLHRFIFASSYTLNYVSKFRDEDVRALRQLMAQDVNLQRARALNQETLILVLKAGAKMSTLNNYGWTPLHYAARFDNLMAAEILVREGANISQRDPNYKTPLDYAVTPAMIRFLKSHSASEQ